MKIENKETEIEKKINKDGGKLKYSDLLKEVIENPPKGGFIGVDEMKKRIRMTTAIECESNGVIEFETGDLDSIKKLINEFGWGVLHKDILNFINYINSIK